MSSLKDLTADIICIYKLKDCPVTSAYELKDAISIAQKILNPGEKLISPAEELDDSWIFFVENSKYEGKIIIGDGPYVINKKNTQYGSINYPTYFAFAENAKKVPFTTDV